MTIRVVLVDDHPVVRAGIRALLDGEPDLAVAAEATDASSALRAVRSLNPDVVVVDLNLGSGADGVELITRLGTFDDQPEVLVLTTYDTEADVLRSLDAGARSFLLKDAPAGELLGAVRRTARGETVLAPSAAAILLRRSAGATALTEREVEVLELLAQGLSNRALARRLLVSEATIKSHLSHLYTKLGVQTRAGAVAAAIERRIIRTSQNETES